MSNKSCSVAKCPNIDYKTKSMVPKVKYFGFPSADREPERHKAWTRFCRRKAVNGKPWVPGSSAKICSKHFMQNFKTYVPTIHPGTPEEQVRQAEKRIERRVMREIAKEANEQKKSKRKSTDTNADLILPSVQSHHLPVTTEAQAKQLSLHEYEFSSSSSCRSICANSLDSKLT